MQATTNFHSVTLARHVERRTKSHAWTELTLVFDDGSLHTFNLHGPTAQVPVSVVDESPEAAASGEASGEPS